jgi:thiamine-monophosphate kinase
VPARVNSEGELIQTYLAPLSRRMPGALGLQDDCAVLVVPPGTELVVTTDAVAAGVHFFENDAAGDIAWKALAVNISDLAAKGAEPLAYQMALSFPEAPSHDWLAGFAKGLDQAQSAFGLGLLGGDTDQRPGPLTITITAFGHVPKGRMVLRSGAQEGDIVFVSGTLGDSALGLKLRNAPDLANSWKLNRAGVDHVSRRYLRPEPRLALGAALRDCASASMDISDGLAKDLGRLCQASRVAANVKLPLVPLSAAAKSAIAADAGLYKGIVSGGDDYEILCTVPPDRTAVFAAAAAASGVPATSIGTVSAGSGLVLEGLDGVPIQLDVAGWDHF